MTRKKITIALALVAVAGIAITLLRRGGGGGDADAGRAGGAQGAPTAITAHSNIAPKFRGKPVPDLETWRDEAPNYPPTGAHMKKMVRYSLKEVLGVELPASAYDFHFAGYFKIPPEDFGPFLDAFIAALQIDPETLDYTGPPAERPQIGFEGNDHVYFTGGGARRLRTARPGKGWNLPLSEGTLGIAFVERATGMQFTYLLDPKTGNCLFGKGRYDD